MDNNITDDHQSYLIKDNLSSYISLIEKFPMLSSEEEASLFTKYQTSNDLAAVEKIVTSYLRLVVKIASSFKNYGLSIMDLISEGNIGLMKAVKKFDVSKGFRLSTYATWWIKATIQDYILKSWSLVKVGTSTMQKKLFFNLNKIKRKIMDQSDSYMSDSQVKLIASQLDATESQVREMDNRINRLDSSLNDVIAYYGDDNQIELLDTLSEEDHINQEELYIVNESEKNNRKILCHALLTLSKRERFIIFKRKLSEIPSTLDVLSKKFAISKERVRQIEEKAMKQIRTMIQNNPLIN